ncbi:MAG: peptide-methionine (S)-S-oxide reductase MsrA [Armatimonadota bacterium]
MERRWLVSFILPVVALMGCGSATEVKAESKVEPVEAGAFRPTPTDFKAKTTHRETAYFAGGCFWGLEYRFRGVKGVTATAVGYSGGHTNNPTYEDVCSHTTGHAEATMVEFEPETVSYKQLATLFFNEFHNPTQMNRQGPDVGDSYRSVLFYSNDTQKKEGEAVKAEIQKTLSEPIVTEFVKYDKFWPAETYHQNYIKKTGHFLCPIDPVTRIK